MEGNPKSAAQRSYILGETPGAPRSAELSSEDIARLSLETIAAMQATYATADRRHITPETVFIQSVENGRDTLEAFNLKLLRDGSGVEGLENLDHCLEELAAGRRVLFISEHRGNLDAPSLNCLLRSADSRYGPLLDKLVYVAGRKLNESSDFINMFAEKYSRIIIVPKREYPPETPDETAEAREARETFEKAARRINWAAFRAMEKLKRQGYVFMLFPTGGRIKPGEHNQPVKESASYIRSFDTAYLISMEGNALPPLERMEDERPIQTRVRFRVGPALDCKAFLAEGKDAFAATGPSEAAEDADRFSVNRIMDMLDNLRNLGRYGA